MRSRSMLRPQLVDAIISVFGYHNCLRSRLYCSINQPFRIRDDERCRQDRYQSRVKVKRFGRWWSHSQEHQLHLSSNEHNISSLGLQGAPFHSTDLHKSTILNIYWANKRSSRAACFRPGLGLEQAMNGSNQQYRLPASGRF